jgi:hypothetical protein
MHLAFLLQREYIPYGKWLGTGFSRLRCAAGLEPVLMPALDATSCATAKSNDTHL